jgi:MscS family membrane protein
MMIDGRARRPYALLRGAATAVGVTIALLVLLAVAIPPVGSIENFPNPLAPPDTDSPRATLQSLQREVEIAEKLVIESYQRHVEEPGWFMSPETQAKEDTIRAHFDRAMRCFDLSGLPPATRSKTGLETAMLLGEIFKRVGVPPADAVPDKTMMKSITDGGGRAQWTVPNTEVRIAKVESGPRAGEYLFTVETVQSAYENYKKVRDVPMADHFDFYSFYALSPGDVLPPKWYAYIQKLPPWFHKVYIDSARWQWIALVLTLLATVAFWIAMFRMTRAHGWLRRRLPHEATLMLLPLSALVSAWLAQQFVNELNFTGPVSQLLSTSFDVAIYLIFTWLVVDLCNRLSDWAAYAWGANRFAFDGGVLRLAIRVVGVLLGTGLLAYGASQIGVPLVGILAGLGVGGIAVALAAQPTIENFIGGIMIYTDRPVRVGETCQFGDMTGVVEEIGIRSTRIRSSDRSLISIPNGDFSKLRLVNLSRRDHILFTSTIGLNYDTKEEQLNNVLKSMRELLAGHPNVDAEKASVNLSAFANSAMEVKISAELVHATGKELAAIREDLLLKIFNIVGRAGATMVAR